MQEVPIKLINVTQKPITLNAETLIGHGFKAEAVKEYKEKKYVRSVNQNSKPRMELSNEEKSALLKQFNIEHLTEDAKRKVENLLWNYADIFRQLNRKLEGTDLVKHRIITEDIPPVFKRPYKILFHQRDRLNQEINKMLDEDIIRPSSSPWNVPVVIVSKKRHPGEDPEIHICVDYRFLNSVSKTDFHPLPLIQDTIDQLTGSSIFTTLDLASGYYQVEITEEDKKKKRLFQHLPDTTNSIACQWALRIPRVRGND